jgi:hypothetical protein
MAVFSRVTSGQIRNGDVVVCPGRFPADSNYVYQPSTPLAWASGEDLELHQTLNGRFRAGAWHDDSPEPATSADAVSATNADAVRRFGLSENATHEVRGVNWSYSQTPSGTGHLRIESPSGTVLHRQDVTAAGAGFTEFGDDWLRGARGQELLVILGNGGLGVTGRVNVPSHRLG